MLTQDLCHVCALPAATVAEACRVIGIDAVVVSLDPHGVDDVLDAAPELVVRAGGEPVGARPGGRGVVAAWAELPAADLVVVAPCGYDLAGALARGTTVAARLPGVPLVAIDAASYVVLAGPGLVDGVEALAWAPHPDRRSAPPPGRVTTYPRT